MKVTPRNWFNIGWNRIAEAAQEREYEDLGFGVRIVKTATRQDALDWIKAGWISNLVNKRENKETIQ